MCQAWVVVDLSRDSQNAWWRLQVFNNVQFNVKYQINLLVSEWPFQVDHRIYIFTGHGKTVEQYHTRAIRRAYNATELERGEQNCPPKLRTNLHICSCSLWVCVCVCLSLCYFFRPIRPNTRLYCHTVCCLFELPSTPRSSDTQFFWLQNSAPVGKRGGLSSAVTFSKFVSVNIYSECVCVWPSVTFSEAAHTLKQIQTRANKRNSKNAHAQTCSASQRLLS